MSTTDQPSPKPQRSEWSGFVIGDPTRGVIGCPNCPIGGNAKTPESADLETKERP